MQLRLHGHSHGQPSHANIYLAPFLHRASRDRQVGIHPLHEKPVEAEKKPVEEPKKSTANEIVNSADTVLVTTAKVKSSSFNSFKPTKPSGFVPATPPNKRRLGRMSPGPEQLHKKHQSIVVPTCTGPDPPSVQWVNELLTWLYNDLVIVNELVQQWIVSMNEFSKKSVEEVRDLILLVCGVARE